MNLLDIMVTLKLDKSAFTTDLRNAESEAVSAGETIEASGKRGGEGFVGGLTSKISEAGGKVVAFGSKMVDIGAKASYVGDSITNKITKPALSAGKALAGMVLSKGWTRLSTLDQAKAKLKAMNIEGEEAAKVFETIEKVVTPTKFSMAEMAEAASMALGSGVSNNKLESYIQAVADTATFANVPLGEMSSVFGKVASNGKLTTEVVQQLADRSVPIWQWLQDSTGKSMDQLKKDVSAGKITLEDFEKAIEDNIGNAAATMGASTLNGAIDSTVAYIGRIGEKFLGASDDATTFAGQVLPLITQFNEWLVTAGDKAAEFGAIFGETFGAVVEYIRTGKVDLDSMSGSAQTLFGVIQPFIDIGKKVVDIGKKIYETLGPQKTALLIAGILAAGPIISLIGNVVGAVGTLITVGGTLISGVGTAISIGSKLLPLIGSVVAAIGPVGVAFLAVAAAIMAAALLIYKHWDDIKDKAKELKAKLDAIWDNIKSSISGKVAALASAVSAKWNAMKSTASAIWNGIKSTISSTVQGIKDKVSSTFDSIKNAISDKMNAAKDKVSSIISAIKGMFPFSIGKLFSGWIPKVSLHAKASGDSATTSSTVTQERFAKAANQPYIFKKATVFERTAGETTDEMLYGKQALMGDIKEAVKDKAAQTVNNFYNTFYVDGAENPESYAARLVDEFQLQMRTA